MSKSGIAKSIMGGLEKTGKVAGQVTDVASSVGQAKQAVGGLMPSMPKFGGGGGGGGGPSVFGGGSNKPKSSTTTIIIMIFALVIFAIIAFWYISSGGLQQSAGSQYVSEQQTQNLLENVWMRRIQNFFSNPFGISASSGTYEDVSEVSQASSSAPNQVFSLSLQVTPSMVTYNSQSLIAVITIQNEGSTTIKDMVISIESQQPARSCVRFSSSSFPRGAECKEEETGKYKCTLLEEIPAFASRQLILTNGYIDRTCVEDSFGDENRQLDTSAPVDVFINVKGSTYYPSSSRLAVERIRTNYGVLLIQNSLLMQQQRGAVYQTGTAVTLDLDVGEQPILSGVPETALLMSWVNVGGGKIDKDKSTILFIVTPEQFGPCVLQGMGGVVITDASEGQVKADAFTRCNTTTNSTIKSECMSENSDATAAKTCEYTRRAGNCTIFAEQISSRTSPYGFFDAMCDQADVLSGNNMIHCMICDKHLQETWCDKTNSTVYRQIVKSAGTAKESFDWACGLIGKGYNVCATNGMGEEFGVMTCKLNTDESIGANRITRYVTAIALYPYVVEAPYATVKAYEPIG